MIRRLQFWIGERAPIEVSDVSIRILGARHHLGFGEDRRECPTVHRSWDDWVQCIQRDSMDWTKKSFERMKKAAQMIGIESMDYDTKLEEIKDKASEMLLKVRSLRPLI